MTATAYTAVVGEECAAPSVRCFGDDGIFRQPVMEAKRYKILSHLFFREDVTIWIDGNVSLRKPTQAVIDELLGDADMALFRHPYSRTVWNEFDTLKGDPRFAIPYLQKQLAAQRKEYREAGLPVDTIPYECNMIIRRNVEPVRRLMDAWWSHICRWQWRDQVSLPFVLWQYPVRLRVISGANIREHPLFDYVSKY